ncbi:acetyl-CoA hydrolase [Pseudolysobacter antarcticus]|uniref:Acetyl-CoA hydrolase n=2 Tax=Pseudolysobacter antarcticus TaxID=2511995 RepID=A0A411HQ47_9GAMM|nr:acetyl-CoA hydrolase [Pseudolysobacter antarcticus]
MGTSALVLATPLGLGKSNHLLNALYARAANDPRLKLHIYTALSLARPRPGSDLEKRFLQLFLDRHFGSDYPDLAYIGALHTNSLPVNVRVSEFYLQSGAMLGVSAVQRDYTSINYTHVARAMAEAEVNVIVHLVARRSGPNGVSYSLSSNPDVTLDLLDKIAASGKPRPLMVAQVHDDLPFLGGDAEVDADFFDLLLDDPACHHQLFALPREPVDEVEFSLGLHASALIRDGGTLQIGIGALSDALIYASVLRHQQNDEYRAALRVLQTCDSVKLIAQYGGMESFAQGLYGASEMIMDGFMLLAKAGVLKRRVYDDLPLQRALNGGLIGEILTDDSLPRLLACGAVAALIDQTELTRLQRFGLLPPECRIDGPLLHFANGETIGIDLNIERDRIALAKHMVGQKLRGGHYLHGAFHLGSSDFYEWLRNLEGEDFSGLAMSRVSHVNELYGGAETLQVAQRRDARFFNTCMMHTLLGAAVSDALENGQVVSGVGGQYNFVAMAHALDDGRSVLMLRSTRRSHGKMQSNILWNYGHTTIPRHLRDIVVSEYGIADLRGKSDEDCIKAMLAICDSRFQDALIATAQNAGKLARDYRLPDSARQNSPQRLRAALQPFKARGLFPAFPSGCDFSVDELRLLPALQLLKKQTASAAQLPGLIGRALVHGQPTAEMAPLLQRMRLDRPHTFAEHVYRRLLTQALRASSSM